MSVEKPVDRLRNPLRPDPEVSMNACELVGFRGYVCESHTVETVDGYLLTIQRIPRGRLHLDNKQKRPVAFLQHGLLCDSTTWITNFENQSLGTAAFILADAGYDVWLGNFRGNTYGVSHVNMTKKDREFWRFSFDEMAEFDLPAMISYVLKSTGETQIEYIGHSQGTMAMFAKLATDQRFGKKIKTFFALAPVTTVGRIKGPLHMVGLISKQLETILENIGYDQFLPSNWITRLTANFVCGFRWTNPLCQSILFLLVGPDSSHLNATRLPVYVAHTPAGTSTRNMAHFGQLVKSKKFRKYDFGAEHKNIEHYGMPSPPDYDLTKVNVPVVLFYGSNDWLADPTDVAVLLSQLSYKIVQASYAIDAYNHMDFLWGLRAAPDIYERILSHLKSTRLVEAMRS